MSNIKDFKDGCKINLDIPRTMTLSGLHYLAKLAQSVPENGIICEIGPYMEALLGFSAITLIRASR